jgi:hypothetical protein
MRMTTIKMSETSASALVQRLYPTLTENQRKQAESALLKANPHLTEAGAFRPGVVVTLPSDTGLKPKPGIVGDDPIDEMCSLLQDSLKVYKDIQATRIGEALAELTTQEKTLGNREVAAAIKNMPNAAELAKDLTVSLRGRKRALAEEKKGQDELFARIGEDIAGIFK